MKEIKKNQGFVTVLTVAVGTFMASLDTSVVNVAMPVIQNKFQVTISMVEWVVIAYLLVISSLLLTFGRLSDLYGHKKIYVSGFMIFTIGSFFCGISSSILMLIACRVIQAVGAGMMFSSGPAIITDAVSAENRGKAFSVSAIAVSVALCVGPVVGGVLLTFAGWQSIFFINIPIGVIGTFLALRNIPVDTRKTTVPFDKVGSALIFVALILILLPLDIVGESKQNPLLFLGMLLAGVFTLVAFVFVEKNTKHPMLNINLFRIRVFTAGSIAAACNFMAQFIMVFLAPFYLEKLRMFTPATAGLLFIPMPLTTMVIAPISGIISDHFDSRTISSLGMGVMAIGLYALSFLKADTSILYIIVAMVITGLGSGMFQAPNNSAVMGSVPKENRGTASGTLATMRNVGMVMGVAVSGALFSLNVRKANVLFLGRGLSKLALQQATFTYALHITFIAGAIVALLAMGASFVKGKVKV